MPRAKSNVPHGRMTKRHVEVAARQYQYENDAVLDAVATFQTKLTDVEDAYYPLILVAQYGFERDPVAAQELTKEMTRLVERLRVLGRAFASDYQQGKF